MTGFDDDRELDDFLARRSTLHRRLADRDRPDPPPELDRLVLSKAREAIDTPTNNAVYRAPRWALPVALAATVVLAFAVVLNMSRLQHAGYPVAASASPSADAAAVIAETGEADALKPTTQGFAAEPEFAEKRAAGTAAPAAASPALARDARPNQPASQLAAATSDADTSSNEARSDSAAASGTSGASRNAPTASNDALLATTSGAVVASREPSRASDVTLAKARAAVPAVAMPRAVMKASSASEASKVLTANNVPASSPLAESTGGARAEYAQAPAAARAIVPAKGEMTASNAPLDHGEITVTGARRARDEAIAGTPLAVQAIEEVQIAPAPAPPPALLTAEAKRANPQAWLREIEALRTAGKTAEADRELAEFRKVFPNEPAKLPPRGPRPVQ